ncbi:hypothetical protein ABFX02_12G013600 [Erythranthe guttata]
MNNFISINSIYFFFCLITVIISSAPMIKTTTSAAAAVEPACKTRCGPLEIKYPFGTGHGCGSPRFHPYVTCSAAGDGGQLRLTTHTGSYQITSISYSDSVLTVAPPCMSNCTSMQPSPAANFGLDWAGPFQLGPSTFILLACSPETYSITVKGNPICDPSSLYLCADIYTCPGVVALGLPLFPPTNTCCVYSPANLGPEDELDLEALGCEGYSSVVALGDSPTDPARWRYGVALKYTLGGLDGYDVAPSCRGCEQSGGVCGYAPPRNSFVCVCGKYGNTTTDCYSYNWIYTSSSVLSSGSIWQGISAAVSIFLILN